ncbi:hypothetical protein KKC08_05085, partial [Patescibacteria group bacterium]|nr:hypothetical protein [Patescibacteria group bacterium]
KNLDHDIDFSPRTKDNLEKIIVIFYAGNEATKRFKGRYDYIGSQSDYKKIGNISIYLTTGGKAEGYFLKYLRERAKDLVKHHWSSVVALAEQLMVKKTMETKEIEDAIRCSWKGGKQNDT